MQDVEKGIGELMTMLMVLCVIFVPLGLWKAIELIIWFFSHLSWQ